MKTRIERFREYGRNQALWAAFYLAATLALGSWTGAAWQYESPLLMILALVLAATSASAMCRAIRKAGHFKRLETRERAWERDRIQRPYIESFRD